MLRTQFKPLRALDQVCGQTFHGGGLCDRLFRRRHLHDNNLEWIGESWKAGKQETQSKQETRKHTLPRQQRSTTSLLFIFLFFLLSPTPNKVANLSCPSALILSFVFVFSSLFPSFIPVSLVEKRLSPFAEIFF